MDTTPFPKAVLNRIGIIKNELLGFGVIVSLILNVSAVPLDAAKNTTQNLGGLVMHLSTIPVLLVFVFIYWYAYLKFPGSQQELMFTEEARRMLLEDSQKKERRRSAKP